MVIEAYPHQQFIHWSKVEQFIKKKLDMLDTDQQLIVTPFSAGYSNLTYSIKLGDWEGVLRRPPFGEIPPKAHDMEREFNILKKINSVFPLAPKPYVYCDNKEMMERPFYVMEKKFGIVIEDKLPEEFSPSTVSGPLISRGIVDTLSHLHTIPYKEAGLEDLGRPDGYVKRQVEAWITRYRRTRTDTITVVNEVEDYLLKNLPPQNPTFSIVHNDFKLNNLMFDSMDPGKIIGVFDWELSTIGDPLSDLAASLAFWRKKGEPDTGMSTITYLDGFISRREFIERYSVQTGFDVTSIDYYLTFSFYKLAGILQQIYARWKKGELVDDRFHDLNKGVHNLMILSYQAMKKEIL